MIVEAVIQAPSFKQPLCVPAVCSHNSNPHRSSPPLPPVPHNSLEGPTSVFVSRSDTDSSDSHISPSIRVLAEMYNFPSIPEPLPVFDDNTSSSSSDSYTTNQYQSGVMMASKRLKEVLSPERPKRSIYATNSFPPEPRKPIPGWTDGSNAWRPSLYSLSPPMDLSKVDPDQLEKSTVAYRSYVVSPHRSQYIQSTLTDINRTSATNIPGCAASPPPYGSDVEVLYSKYSQSLSRRSESRSSLFHSGSPTSPHSPTQPHRRERPLVAPSAEGKLLVPNVKMRVHGGSSLSLSSAWCGSSYPGSLRRGSSSTKDSDSVRSGSPLQTSFPRVKGPRLKVSQSRTRWLQR